MTDTIVQVLVVAGIVGAIGAIIGLVLAFASQIFHVEVDPRFDLIVDNLPGFNCGACGYAGCAGMAEGLMAGEANVTSCTPGNALTYAKVKAILAGEDPNTVVVETKKPVPGKTQATAK